MHTSHSNTIGIMFTMTTYGTWLRGDERGWVEDGITKLPDPILKENDELRSAFSPFKFEKSQINDVGNMIGKSLIGRLHLTILGLTVQKWHVHFVIAATKHETGKVAKCAKDAVRYGLRPGRPIWTTGYDKRFCFDEVSLRRHVAYVERHNEEEGRDAQPWSFITSVEAYLSQALDPKKVKQGKPFGF